MNEMKNNIFVVSIDILLNMLYNDERMLCNFLFLTKKDIGICADICAFGPKFSTLG